MCISLCIYLCLSFVYSVGFLLLFICCSSALRFWCISLCMYLCLSCCMHLFKGLWYIYAFFVYLIGWMSFVLMRFFRYFCVCLSCFLSVYGFLSVLSAVRSVCVISCLYVLCVISFYRCFSLKWFVGWCCPLCLMYFVCLLVLSFCLLGAHVCLHVLYFFVLLLSVFVVFPSLCIYSFLYFSTFVYDVSVFRS